MEVRDRIRECALTLFAERGYHRTSLQVVATEAGVSKGLVLYHFGSKKQLLEEIVQGYYEGSRVFTSNRLRSELPLRERFQLFIRNYFEYTRDNSRYARMLYSLAGADEDILRLSHEHFQTMTKSVVGDMEGLLPESGPLSVEHFLLTLQGSVVNFYALRHNVHGIFDRYPEDEELERERLAHLEWVMDALLNHLMTQLAEGM